MRLDDPSPAGGTGEAATQGATGGRQEHVRADAPAWTPEPRELAHLEMLLAGAYRPLTGFLGEADAAAVEAYGTLADGTPWPVPIILPVPDRLSGADALTLQDPEGAPLAALDVRERWRRDGVWHLAGPVQRLEEPAYGAFRRLRRTPAGVVAELGGPALAVVADRPLLRPDAAAVTRAAESLDARVLVLPLLTVPRADALVRAVLAVRDELPAGTLVVPVPLPSCAEDGREPDESSAEDGRASDESSAEDGLGRGESSAEDSPQRDELLRAHVAAAYGATHLLGEVGGAEGPAPRVAAPEMAYDATGSAWRPAGEIPRERREGPPTRTQLAAMLDGGEPLPERLASPALAAELRRARPPLAERGLTVFFTGLSGSGKSTIARRLYDALLERGDRTVTLLDGDVVRRLLSAGLTFSKADRDLNIRRIGYVAAEASRHGGLAICAPIAPYAATRAEVHRMVEEVGDFALVHVATPLEECERRDRKGLYAMARAGEIQEFTGISDPYEEPDDAELVLDTTEISVEDSVRAVLDMLTRRGWLRRPAPA